MILTFVKSDESKNDKFRMLYDRYAALVYHIAFGKLGNHEKAEDCVQEVFFYLAKNMNNIGEIVSPATKCYVATIAEGKAISMFRKDIIRVCNNIDDCRSLPDVSALQDYEAADLSAALDTLPDEIRNIIILKYLYGYKSKEIAAFYGISSSLVRKKLQKGIQALKDEMKGD